MIYDKFFKYKDNATVFIETGTWCGQGVINAIDSEFDEIHSIELDEQLYKDNIERFKHNPNVNLYHGDSSIILYDVIKNINKRMLFWLDGHYSGHGTSQSNVTQLYEFPLIYEIQQIDKHHIKDHIILIDDLRCFPSFEEQEKLNYKTKYSLDILTEELLKINNNYKFRRIDGFVDQDILLVTTNDLPNVAYV
jgi:hypothetical protein